MKKVYSILCLLMFTSLSSLMAQKKWQWGVGAEVFQTQLNNVDRENYDGYGHSVPGFKQKDKLGFGATFLMKRPIYKKLSFETGLGINNFRSQFHFNYTHRITNSIIDEKLNISILSLYIPVFINYKIPVQNTSSINIALGFNTRAQVFNKDNFNDIIYELLIINPYRYRLFIISPHFSMGYSLQLKHKKSIQVSAFLSRDMSPFVIDKKNVFGFYKNLSTAHYISYGLSLKYFLPNKNSLINLKNQEKSPF